MTRPKLKLNWTRKLKNEEFKGLSHALWEVTHSILKDSIQFEMFMVPTKQAHDELMSLSSDTRDHYNTKKINEWHKERKKILTSMTTECLQNTKHKNFLKNHMEHIDKYVFLNRWFREYGKRLYDFGIDRLTGVVNGLKADYNLHTEFKEAIDICYKDKFDELLIVNNLIVKAQTERTIDLSMPKRQRPYREVRNSVMKEWKSLFFGINLFLFQNYPYFGNKEELINLLYTQQQILTDYRRIVKQRETKRANKKAKLEEHKQHNATSTND